MAHQQRHLSVRIPDRLFQRLDAVAEERGWSRARVVKQALEAALVGTKPPPPPDTPDETELLALLSERARAGNVGAIRALLAREAEQDPRARALAVLEGIAQTRQS